MNELPPETIAAVFGTSLRQIRESREWSQSELARQMHKIGWDKYSQVTVSRTEEGTRTVRLDEAFALAQVLSCEVRDLLTPDRRAQKLREWREEVRTSAQEILGRIDLYFGARSHLVRLIKKTEADLIEEEDMSDAVRNSIKSELANAKNDADKNYIEY